MTRKISFQSLLRTRRMEKGISVVAMAKAAGLPAARIWYLERTLDVRLTPQDVEGLARALEIDPLELLAAAGFAAGAHK